VAPTCVSEPGLDTHGGRSVKRVQISATGAPDNGFGTEIAGLGGESREAKVVAKGKNLVIGVLAALSAAARLNAANRRSGSTWRHNRGYYYPDSYP
jgi:hypothetical protein